MPSLYRRLFSYIRPYRASFLVALGCMVVFGASDGAIPFLIQHILDGIFTRHDESTLYLMPLLIVGFALIRAGSDFIQEYFMEKVGHLVVRDLRRDLNAHILKLSPDFFARESSGNLLSRITSDVQVVKNVLTASLASMIRDSIRVIALLIAALALDPVLALIAFVVFPLAIYPVYRFGRRIRKLSRRGQEAVGMLSVLLQESILGQKVVKIFLQEEYEKERFNKKNDELAHTFLKSEKVRALTGPLNEVLASFAIAGVLLYGGMSVLSGARSQGEFVAFLASLFLLYEPLKKLSKVHNTLQPGLSGAERVFEVLDAVPTVRSPDEPLPLAESHHISFRHVSFRYPQAGREALSNIELEISEGSKVALVGFSGAGKSTLIDLIPRFHDPLQGEILLGGVDIKKLGLEALRSQIALVGQHTFLFQDTIAANIRYGKSGADKKQIEEAAKAAYVHDFIQSLPDGYDTLVGEGGHTLSGGERQRIAIARALLKDAPILILDEATSSLDNRAEREVQAALKFLLKGRTSVVIAHRLSTILDVDQILVLRDGNIVERGSHDELLRLDGEYKKLYLLQFSDHATNSS